MRPLDADLIAYYDAEARGGLRGPVQPARAAFRQQMTDGLRRKDASGSSTSARARGRTR